MTSDVNIDPHQPLFDVSPDRGRAWWQSALGPLRRLNRSTLFGILATLVLGMTMAFVGQLVSTRIEHASAESAGEAAALYMEAFLEPYVQELGGENDLSAASIQAIDRLMSSTSLNEHIVSVKIWRPDATILYSTDKSEEHKNYPKEEIARAARGEIVTSLSPLEAEENHFERSLNEPLYETYAPLRQFGTGKILAVGEFYEQKHEIVSLQQEVWAVIIAATLAMILLLFFIVRRGDQIIEQQQLALRQQMQEQAQLHLQNAALQDRITTANHEFSRISELILRRLGADLHDGPAQLLSLILLRLDELAELQERYRLDSAHQDSDTVETIRSAAQDALREVRNLSRGLALPEINELTLSQELALVTHRHEQRSETKVELHLDGLPEQIPPLHKICLYRFAEEALNNAVRHAGGKGQSLSASYRDGILELVVADAGPGINQSPPAQASHERSRLGLEGMRYRVESLGGLFNIDSPPGQGTRVSAQFTL
ncbi:sensor histidine kinase [Pseudomonas cavernae]|uniref:histidine kinase n=1 Tax=Pseudomonas cavernae TaxID=2320867 RepID=A0A385Z716_9PSED|nr:ATP-binding protein [Pseudomonas cavernae]AYC33763.1 sensor histidine kinase [Pseudomonas cavernae]